MDSTLFGAKDFYDVTFKATYDMTIGDRQFKEGEVLARFDNIQIATIDEQKREWAARGGYDNRAHVIWSETQNVIFSFSQGIFSKIQLAILNNAKLISLNKDKSKLIPITENKESNEDGVIELKFTPAAGTLQIHDANTGERIDNYQLEEYSIIVDSIYTNYIIDYYIDYTDAATTLQVGAPLTNGYIKVEGKTRLKDDNTGKIVTGILEIPKMRLKTGLSMRLGEDAIPMVASFQGEGLPVGVKGNKKVCTLDILSDDIDSDF